MTAGDARPDPDGAAWAAALERVLAAVDAPLAREGVAWAVVGSVATVLQGCPLAPRDLDLSVATPAGVHRVAALMVPFAAAQSDAPPGDLARWVSTRALPVAAAPPDPDRDVWTFGRWSVGGFKVEAAHIARPEDRRAPAPGEGLRETGQRVWPHVRRVPFRGYAVPVVPLEIQLGVSYARGLADRVEATASVFRRAGYDRELLARSLPAEHAVAFDALLRAG